MSEENKKNDSEAEFDPILGDGKDKVGDILRKERLTRRITAETIAKDLKLNVSYIKALEASDFSALPPEPYIRVYIKSLTKYLSLDTEYILREFDRECGLISDNYDKNVNKIDVRVSKQEKSPTFVVAAVLIVILGVFAFIANQKGWLTIPEDDTAVAVESKPDTVSLLDSAAAAQRMSEDSSLAALNEPHDSTAAAKTPPRP